MQSSRPKHKCAALPPPPPRQNPHLEKWIMERDDIFFELQTSWHGNGGSDSQGMHHVADVEIMASKTCVGAGVGVVVG
jgi:hypothetical protein